MKTELQNSQNDVASGLRPDSISFLPLCILCLSFFLLGTTVGELYTAHAERAWAENLIRAARFAEGEYAGTQLRHVAIGTITNILIAPDHVAVFGREGSRQWFP